MYELLEAEGIGYTIRLPANNVLQDRIRYLLKRPVGRPPHEVRRYYASYSYQAQSWKKRRRIVAKVRGYPDADRPTAGTAGARVTRKWDRIRQAETAEVRLDQIRTAGSSASTRLTAVSERLLRTRRAIVVAEEAQEPDHGLNTVGNLGNVG
jgi:hypothetical protein